MVKERKDGVERARNGLVRMRSYGRGRSAGEEEGTEGVGR